jgi:hypothetical protein
VTTAPLARHLRAGARARGQGRDGRRHPPHQDCRATGREFEARGLELAQQPVERFYGIDATFRDPSGNLWRIVQELDSA